MWQANVFTIFPNAFPGSLGVSSIGRALASGEWNLNLVDLKQFPVKSDRIDSTPCGGGVGMVLSPICFEQAFNSLDEKSQKMRRIYCSPRGSQLRQADLDDISKSDGLTVLCGRYEGVDQRILDSYEIEEVSIGDFVLLGGEAAAMTIIEGCVRLLPNIVGDKQSISSDSFQQNLLEYNQYTQPQIFHEIHVPSVLLSGDHSKINAYREEQSKILTIKKRPDLWARYVSDQMSKISR